MKKLFLPLIMLLIVFTLTACKSGIEVAFKVDGETYETIELEEAGALSSLPRPEKDGYFFLGWHLDEDFEERFDYRSVVEESITLYARFIEDDGELNTVLTDELSIPDYEGKSFFEDGIGEVELLACRDGDTADFTDGEQDFRVRYLGLDTPESGHLYEPWGVAASRYACELKENADTIVLERDEAAGDRGTYRRELAYVWADGRLLNLELIELAYSPGVGAGELKYGFDMRLAHDKANLTGLGIHTQEDPDFNYDAPVETTIENIVQNPEDYRQASINLEGVVAAKVGQHAFIQSLDGEYGIFFYIGYATTERLEIGYEVRIENAQVYHDGKPFDGLFLTNFGGATITPNVDNLDAEYTVHTTPFSDLTFEKTGLPYAYEDLLITEIETLAGDILSMTLEDESGDTMRVYQLYEPPLLNDTQHSLMPRAHRVNADNFEEGMRIDIRMNLSEVEGELAFVLSHRDDITILD